MKNRQSSAETPGQLTSPREFWIDSAMGDIEALEPDAEIRNQFIHAIEYSAYESLRAENEKLKADLYRESNRANALEFAVNHLRESPQDE